MPGVLVGCPYPVAPLPVAEVDHRHLSLQTSPPASTFVPTIAVQLTWVLLILGPPHLPGLGVVSLNLFTAHL